jgi:hypothetical protein
VKNAYRIVRTAASSSVKSLVDEKRKTCPNLLFSVLWKGAYITGIGLASFRKVNAIPVI